MIEDLVAGKDVRLAATSYGTDCYPRKELETIINIKDLNEAMLVNPRNAYQNYNVAVNAGAKRTIYTYMGILRPNMGNANYCSAGQLSPLLNDPYYRTIGIGTRIFLGGGVGYVFWQGTQHNPADARNDTGPAQGGAGPSAVIGDMKQMSTEFIRGASFRGYGVSLGVGIGVPIPILDEEMARFTSVSRRGHNRAGGRLRSSISAEIPEKLGEVAYAELRSGRITVNGKEIPTGAISSYAKARKIAETLKAWIAAGQVPLGQPCRAAPAGESRYAFHPLRERKK